MANNQALSPQGYNIKDEPYNVNPFWGDDENPDPTIYQRLTALENDVEDLDEDKLDASEINNYYTKTEIDDKFNALPEFDESNYYTKTEVDTAIGTEDTSVKSYVATNYYNKTQIDNSLSTKANISTFNNYYTKTEIDASLGDITDDIDSLEDTVAQHTQDLSDMNTALGNMDDTVTDLSSDVTNAVSDVTAMNTRVGNLETAITNVYTKSQVDTLLADKADVSDLPDMTNYYTKTQVDGLIPDVSDFVTTSDLSDALDDYYDKTYIDNTLGDIQSLLEAI